MSKIKIDQLPTDSSDSSSLKELNYWETSSITGGAGAVSTKALLFNAMQQALARSDDSQNSRLRR